MVSVRHGLAQSPETYALCPFKPRHIAMPSKRKLENFDPNKSDSDDDDFEPALNEPRKSASRPKSKRSSGNPRKVQSTRALMWRMRLV